MAVVAPKQTPQDIIESLSGEISSLTYLPDVQVRLAAVGFEPAAMDATEADTIIRAEADKWTRVIRLAGVRRYATRSGAGGLAQRPGPSRPTFGRPGRCPPSLKD